MSEQNPDMKPFVLRGYAKEKKYAPMQWNMDDLPEWFKEKEIEARVASRGHVEGKIEYEVRCSRVQFESSAFFKWVKGQVAIDGEESYIRKAKKRKITKGTHWVYVDYRNVQAFLKPEFAKQIPFAERLFGLPKEPVDEACWIGTPGAHTPCHYDTYGFNVHVQIAGRKRWILFPPSDSMRPSRFPYEESTVYSRYDVAGGQVPSDSKPHLVDLEPGDVLFVPPYWWHCVIVLDDPKSDFAFSVTKWVPIKEDDDARLKEAALKCLMHVLQARFFGKEHRATARQEADTTATYLLQLLETEPESNDGSSAAKRPRFVPSVLDSFYERFSKHGEILTAITLDELKERLSEDNPFQVTDNKSPLPKLSEEYTWLTPLMDIRDWSKTLHDVFDAFCDDSTIALVLRRLKNRQETKLKDPNPNIKPLVLANYATKDNFRPMGWDRKDYLKLYAKGLITRYGSRASNSKVIPYEKLCSTITFEAVKSFLDWADGKVAVDLRREPEGKLVVQPSHWLCQEDKVPSMDWEEERVPNKDDKEIVKGEEEEEEEEEDDDEDEEEEEEEDDEDEEDHDGENENDPEGYRDFAGTPLSVMHDPYVWFATPGATTPLRCGIGCYSLRVQVAGRSRWTLFPPDDPMRPSRFPYRKNMVYSRRNVDKGDIPKNCHPFTVDMMPGDVLFIPPHWWHSVTVPNKLEFSLCATSWVPIEMHVIDRTRECVIDCFMPFIYEGHCIDSVNPLHEAEGKIHNLEILLGKLHIVNGGRDFIRNQKPRPPMIQPEVASVQHFFNNLTSNVQKVSPLSRWQISPLKLHLDQPYKVPPINEGSYRVLKSSDEYCIGGPELHNWSPALHDVYDAFLDNVDHVIRLVWEMSGE